MQILQAVIVAAVAVMPTPGALQRSEAVLVRHVVDGQTIEVSAVGRVRLLGIEAPPVGRAIDGSRSVGREARDRLASLVLGRWIRLEQEASVPDARRRREAFVVREDGVFVNAVLVREGLARLSARAPQSRLAELQSAERDAQSSHRGMWSRTSPQAIGAPLASKRHDRYTAKSGTSQKRQRPRQHGAVSTAGTQP
jgi:micrococcal nuclease